jgi:hypothetical protein
LQPRSDPPVPSYQYSPPNDPSMPTVPRGGGISTKSYQGTACTWPGAGPKCARMPTLPWVGPLWSGPRPPRIGAARSRECRKPGYIPPLVSFPLLALRMAPVGVNTGPPHRRMASSTPVPSSAKRPASACSLSCTDSNAEAPERAAHGCAVLCWAGGGEGDQHSSPPMASDPVVSRW